MTAETPKTAVVPVEIIALVEEVRDGMRSNAAETRRLIGPEGEKLVGMMHARADAIDAVLSALANRDAPATGGGEPVGPGGWLIKDFADGWIWTDRRIAAVAALTDGHSVFDLTRQEYASPQDDRMGDTKEGEGA